VGLSEDGQNQLNIKPIASVLDGIPALDQHWIGLVKFAAAYYQRSLGEMALQALPPQLRDLDSVQMARRLKKVAHLKPAKDSHRAEADTQAGYLQQNSSPPLRGQLELTREQEKALQQIQTEQGPFLLFGSTGSGKTEIYLRSVAAVLERSVDSQILIMVPEINLTPQLEQRFRTRFARVLQDLGPLGIVSMHSGMTPAQRLQAWLSAHFGHARIVLGTRMAIFSSFSNLQLIVVDEEHDPSYKQQEGARYSARDLAIYRAKQLGIKVILGSATPSLESWHHAHKGPTATGSKYQLLTMPSRIGNSAMPKVQLMDMNLQPRGVVFAAPLMDAIKSRVHNNEQVLILLNRRGYAPVLHCQDCDWKSECEYCSAFKVFHKTDRTLRCHHCGLTQRVPKFCPACGNADISPIGKGTEQLEEVLADLLRDVRQPSGEPVQILRIDADSTRLKGELDQQLAKVHSGEVNILVGTQMIAKGHDFRKITLVVALYPDAALFSSDFRAPERLFALLLQAAGRAGRDAALSHVSRSQMWIQTQYPEHPLYQALKTYDYPSFANQQLDERRQAHLPPFSYQALVRAEAKTQELAQAFLNAAQQSAKDIILRIQSDYSTDTAKNNWVNAEPVLYPAIAMTMQRVANVERAQMLIECDSRLMLQEFLKLWQVQLQALQPAYKGVIRWAVDVDPLAI
jgi:primosomal protein N' (replication factor Y)